jgi:hypothetical protein
MRLSLCGAGASALPPSFRSVSPVTNGLRFVRERSLVFENAGPRASGRAEALAPQSQNTIFKASCICRGELLVAVILPALGFTAVPANIVLFGFWKDG